MDTRQSESKEFKNTAPLTFSLTSSSPQESKETIEQLILNGILAAKIERFTVAEKYLSDAIKKSEENIIQGTEQIRALLYTLRAEARQELAIASYLTSHTTPLKWDEAKKDYLKAYSLTKHKNIPEITLGTNPEKHIDPIDLHEQIIIFYTQYAEHEASHKNIDNAKAIYLEANKFTEEKNIDLLISTSTFFNGRVNDTKMAMHYSELADNLLKNFITPIMFINPDAYNKQAEINHIAIQIYNAEMAYRQNNLDKAMGILLNVIIHKDDIVIDGNTHFLLAKIYYKKDDLDNALKHYKNTRTLFDDIDVPAHLLLKSFINMRRGEYDHALDDLLRAINDADKNETSTDCAEIIKLVMARELTRTESNEFLDIRKQANNALLNNNVSEAIELSYKALKIIPADASCYAFLSLAEEIKNSSAAERYTNILFIAKQLDKLNPIKVFNLSQLSLFIGQTDDLGKAYLRIVEKFEAGKNSTGLTKEQRYPIFLPIIQEIEKHPSLKRSRVISTLLGRSYYNIGNIKAAKPILCELDTQPTILHREIIKMTLAWINADQLNYQEAINYTIDAINQDQERKKIADEDIKILSYIATKQKNASTKNYKSTELTKKMLTKNIAGFLQNKEYDKAIPLMIKNIEIDPSNYSTHHQLANIYLLQKNYNECIKYCSVAIRLIGLNKDITATKEALITTHRTRREAAAKLKKFNLSDIDHEIICSHLSWNETQKEVEIYNQLKPDNHKQSTLSEMKSLTNTMASDFNSSLYNVAEKLYEINKLSEAIHYCNIAIESESKKHAHHHLLLGLCYAKSNSSHSSIKHLHKAYSIIKSYEDENEKKNDTKNESKKDNNTDLKFQINQCKQLIHNEVQRSDTSEIKSTLIEFKSLINMPMHEQDRSKVTETCKKAIQLTPSDPELYVALVNVLEIGQIVTEYSLMNLIEIALFLHSLHSSDISYNSKSLPTKKSSVTRDLLNAHYAIKNNDYKNSIKFFTKHSITFEINTHRLALAISYCLTKQPATAIKLLLETKSNNPVERCTRDTYLALCYIDQDKYIEAIQSLQDTLASSMTINGISFDPKPILLALTNAMQHTSRKKILDTQLKLLKARLNNENKSNELIKLYADIFKSPQQPSLYFARAAHYHKINAHNEAIRDITIGLQLESLKESPDNIVLLEGLKLRRKILVLIGNKEQATFDQAHIISLLASNLHDEENNNFNQILKQHERTQKSSQKSTETTTTNSIEIKREDKTSNSNSESTDKNNIDIKETIKQLKLKFSTIKEKAKLAKSQGNYSEAKDRLIDALAIAKQIPKFQDEVRSIDKLLIETNKNISAMEKSAEEHRKRAPIQIIIKAKNTTTPSNKTPFSPKENKIRKDQDELENKKIQKEGKRLQRKNRKIESRKNVSTMIQTSALSSFIDNTKNQQVETKHSTTLRPFKKINFNDLPSSIFKSAITLPDENQIYPAPADIISALIKEGYTADFVGGTTLSLTLENTPKGDFDLRTNAPCDAILRILKSFGAVEHPHKKNLFSFHGLSHQDGAIDLYSIGNKTDQEDSEDRDFTICNIVGKLDFTNNILELYDITGKGVTHATTKNNGKNGIVDTTIDPLDSFITDPIRILREIKFETNYNFSPSERVANAIPKRLPQLIEHSQKNPIAVNLNLEYLLCNGNGLKNFKRLNELNILEKLFPTIPFKINGQNNMLITSLLCKMDEIVKKEKDTSQQILELANHMGISQSILIHRTHGSLMTKRPINLLYAYLIAISLLDANTKEELQQQASSLIKDLPLIKISADRCSIFDAMMMSCVDKISGKLISTATQTSNNVNITVNIHHHHHHHNNTFLIFNSNSSRNNTPSPSMSSRSNQTSPTLFNNKTYLSACTESSTRNSSPVLNSSKSDTGTSKCTLAP